MFLSDLRTGLHVLGGGHHTETFIAIHGRENHTLALDAHHLAGLEVGHEEHTLADEFLGIFVEGSNAGADGTVSTAAVIKSELQEFLRLLHFLTVLDESYADIEFFESFERNVLLHGCSLIVGSSVDFLGSFQFVDLLLNHVILEFLEEQ